jgi:hypothetical protein
MVQFIDNLEFEKAKMLGPRIKVLVEQLSKLFQSVVLLHVDKKGDFKLQLVYIISWCLKCRAIDHPMCLYLLTKT